MVHSSVCGGAGGGGAVHSSPLGSVRGAGGGGAVTAIPSASKTQELVPPCPPFHSGRYYHEERDLAKICTPPVPAWKGPDSPDAPDDDVNEDEARAAGAGGGRVCGGGGRALRSRVCGGGGGMVASVLHVVAYA